jgi:hypothetical protein
MHDSLITGELIMIRRRTILSAAVLAAVLTVAGLAWESRETGGGVVPSGPPSIASTASRRAAESHVGALGDGPPVPDRRRSVRGAREVPKPHAGDNDRGAFVTPMVRARLAPEPTPMVTETLPAAQCRLSHTPGEFATATPTSCVAVHPAGS